MLVWFATVAGSFLTSLVLHAVACRLPLNADRVIRFLAVGTGVGLVLLLSTMQRYGLFAIETVAAILVYALLCELYLFLFTVTISSISANLLVRLRSGDMTLSEIEQRYDSRKMVQARLDRLESTGFLHYDGGRILIAGKGARFLSVFQSLRRFFRHADVEH
jgi:hypothetical protein